MAKVEAISRNSFPATSNHRTPRHHGAHGLNVLKRDVKTVKYLDLVGLVLRGEGAGSKGARQDREEMRNMTPSARDRKDRHPLERRDEDIHPSQRPRRVGQPGRMVGEQKVRTVTSAAPQLASAIT